MAAVVFEGRAAAVADGVLQEDHAAPGVRRQAGLGRGLAFDLFKPGQVEVKDFYAELPITIRVLPRATDKKAR